MATIGGVRSVYQSWQMKPGPKQEQPKQEQKASSRDKQRSAENKKQNQPSTPPPYEEAKSHIDDYA